MILESRLGAGNRKVDLIVSDNGCGIDSRQMSHIFDPFYSTKSQGTGLGLAVIYGLVRNHEGTINVSSKVGEGTTFTVSLPLDQEEYNGSVDVRRQTWAHPHH